MERNEVAKKESIGIHGIQMNVEGKGDIDKGDSK